MRSQTPGMPPCNVGVPSQHSGHSEHARPVYPEGPALRCVIRLLTLKETSYCTYL